MTSVLLIALEMHFVFQKLLCRQRTMKIARVATLTRATRQLKQNAEKKSQEIQGVAFS